MAHLIFNTRMQFHVKIPKLCFYKNETTKNIALSINGVVQKFKEKFSYPVGSGYKTKYREGHVVTCGILEPPCPKTNGPP